MGVQSQNQNQNQNQFYYQRNTFLPMLCSRPSIKEVTLPRFLDRSASSGNDPLSPRISCMGQVKRKNKIASHSHSHSHSHRLTFQTKTNSTSSPSVKYSKLKKLFSAKNFIISTPKTISTCRSDVAPPKSQRCFKIKSENNNNNVVCISIENMDPPLPVVKRFPKLEEGKEFHSLWKRRSGTARPALQNLQLQQIHHPIISPQPPTV